MRKKEVVKKIKLSEKQFYVYGLIRPDAFPFYIGEGQKYRIFDHEYGIRSSDYSNQLKLDFILAILIKKKELYYRLYGFFDTKEESLDLEKKLIKRYGRIDLGTGILTNMTDGGEFPSNISDETRKKLSDIKIKFYEDNPDERHKRSKYVTNWHKENPERSKWQHDLATETQRKPENREQKRQIQLKFMKEHPEEFQETMDKTHETRRRPENRKANSERLQSYYCKPGSKERSSQIALKWIKDNPKEYQEIIELSNEGKRTPEARAKSRLEYIKEHPEEEQKRLEKMCKTSRTIESREINSQTQIRAANRKRKVKIRIQSLIKTHNLTNITLPDGRSSIKKFQELEEELLKTINTLPE